jgi:hypothetical protein
MRRYRIGVFGWKTSPVDGGSDTILRTLNEKILELPSNGRFEIVQVPWQVWDRRR